MIGLNLLNQEIKSMRHLIWNTICNRLAVCIPSTNQKKNSMTNIWKIITVFIQQIINGYANDSLLAQITDSTPYHTTKGRTVYGGGGIYPDHIISYKSDTLIVYYNQLVTKGIISEYVFDFVSRKGREIKKQHPDAEDFIAHYTVSNDMLEDVFDQAANKGLVRNNNSIKKYRKEILSRIKAEIGDMLYGTPTFQAVMLWSDPELQEALTLFKKR